MSKKNKKKKLKKQDKFVQSFPPRLFGPDGNALHKSGVNIYGFSVTVVEK